MKIGGRIIVFGLRNIKGPLLVLCGMMIYLCVSCSQDTTNNFIEDENDQSDPTNQISNEEDVEPLLSDHEGWPVLEGIHIEEDRREITLTNSEISFTVMKYNATITNLKKKGKYEEQNLLEKGGEGYYLLNYVLDGSKGETTFSSMEYELVSRTKDRVIFSLTVDNPIKIPFTAKYYFAMESGFPGIYVYSVFTYDEHMPDHMEIEQSRYSVRANPELFTHYGIEDLSGEDRHGEFPKLEDIREGETLMDATTRLPNGEVYTKYNHSVYVGDNRVNGIFGEDIGLSIIRPSSEYLVGGPWKQEYFVEQTATTPLVHFYEQVRHFGVPNVTPDKGWEKIYGPYVIYLNEAEGFEDLWTDVKRQTDEEVLKWPYAWVENPLYAARNRSDVEGTLKITDGSSPENAWVILGQEGLPIYEQNLDYIYYARADENGHFHIPAVRPGQYTLFATVDGVFGEFKQDNITVSEQSTTTLETISWTPKTNGETLWTIGTPDRTPREFKHGDELRQWGLWLEYPLDFPEDVNFIIGESDEKTDWNYAQPNIRTPGQFDHLLVPRDHSLTEWNIYFDLQEGYEAGEGILTIAIAASADGSLHIQVNDEEIYKTDKVSPLRNDAAYYRSGVSGYYHLIEVSFPACLLTKGRNSVTLQHAKKQGGSTVAIMYDALRMEIKH